VTSHIAKEEIGRFGPPQRAQFTPPPAISMANRALFTDAGVHNLERLSD
jgi:hypothetical protein